MARRKMQWPLVLYGTKEVAKILGIPEWRVKNFSEGAAYKLSPAVQVGRGRGSRKLYGWNDMFRLGIADELVKFGFSPESVGEAIGEIPNSIFGPYEATIMAERLGRGSKQKTKETPLLVKQGAAWRLVEMLSNVAYEWGTAAKHGESSRALFVLNIANVCDSILDRLNRYWTGDLDSSDETRGKP